MITNPDDQRAEKYTSGQSDDNSFLFWMGLGAFSALAFPFGFLIVSQAVTALCHPDADNSVCTGLAKLSLMFPLMVTQGILLIFAIVGRVLEKRHRRRYWSMRIAGIALYPVVTLTMIALAF